MHQLSAFLSAASGVIPYAAVLIESQKEEI